MKSLFTNQDSTLSSHCLIIISSNLEEYKKSEYYCCLSCTISCLTLIILNTLRTLVRTLNDRDYMVVVTITSVKDRITSRLVLSRTWLISIMVSTSACLAQGSSSILL